MTLGAGTHFYLDDDEQYKSELKQRFNNCIDFKVYPWLWNEGKHPLVDSIIVVDDCNFPDGGNSPTTDDDYIEHRWQCGALNQHVFIEETMTSSVTSNEKHWYLNICPQEIANSTDFRQQIHGILLNAMYDEKTQNITFMGKKLFELLQSYYTARKSVQEAFDARNNNTELEPRYRRNMASGLIDMNPMPLTVLSNDLVGADRFASRDCPYCRKWI